MLYRSKKIVQKQREMLKMLNLSRDFSRSTLTSGGGDCVSRASLEKMSTCSTFFGVLMALFFTSLFKIVDVIMRG